MASLQVNACLKKELGNKHVGSEHTYDGSIWCYVVVPPDRLSTEHLSTLSAIII